MKSVFTVMMLVCVASACRALDGYVISIADGIPNVSKFSTTENRPLATNEYPIDYAFPTNAPKHWKKVGTDWVAMTAEDQAAVDAAEQEAIDKKKTAKQKTAENDFFALSEELLVMIGDPRARQTPPIKLTVDELSIALGEFLETGNPGQQRKASRVSLRLLAIDAKLMRFDPQWWDKASSHVIEEPPAQ